MIPSPSSSALYCALSLARPPRLRCQYESYLVVIELSKSTFQLWCWTPHLLANWWRKLPGSTTASPILAMATRGVPNKLEIVPAKLSNLETDLGVQDLEDWNWEKGLSEKEVVD